MGIKDRQKREKIDRIALILRNARKIINAKGINSFTIDELSEKTELSRGAIYYYFKNKYEIFLKIITDENFKMAKIYKRFPENEDCLKWYKGLLKEIYDYNKKNKIALEILIYLAKNMQLEKNIKNKELRDEYIKSIYASTEKVHIIITKGQQKNQIKASLAPFELAFSLMTPLLTFLNLVTDKNYNKMLENLYKLDSSKIFDDYVELTLDALKA
ncbi:MAG: helix-turn-helix transcriptional regulator [Actinobacteria bacterium]|nr:helix-turn-helix transcriptional regulator [Actinomycetota bacterium]